MIKIIIPFKTPSINHLHGHNKFGAFYLKPEAKELRKEIKKIVDATHQIISQKEVPLKIVVEIHENWYTQKGTVKKIDVANREKFLIDSVFEALGMDDKFIFEHIMKKVQSKNEKAIVMIYEQNRPKTKQKTNLCHS